MLRGPDGSYQLQLNLTPAHLGAVHILVEMRNGELTIQMNAIDTAARDLLKDHLETLRQDLQNMGLKANQVDINGGREQAARQWAPDQGLGDPTGSGRRGHGPGNPDGLGRASGADDNSTYLGDDSDAASTITRGPQGDTLDVRV
ncbi:MAG: flagellar hook-length control protein FliK [Micrococcales bacterium]|nr:flagellar hook-length control protein FliK [Micrococcales bacterium]